MAGVAVLAAGSIALPTSVPPSGAPAARHDSVALTAQTRAFDTLPAALVTVRPPAPDEAPEDAEPASERAHAAAGRIPIRSVVVRSTGPRYALAVDDEGRQGLIPASV
ncbi:hypothetical protein, partial [Mycolicibacterium bacteremicum]|uniref:hypothetical protein n=1 Tax=Mycolicibacterium bacteremicum TaxID=564198 RepID=UPI0026E9EBA7